METWVTEPEACDFYADCNIILDNKCSLSGIADMLIEMFIATGSYILCISSSYFCVSQSLLANSLVFISFKNIFVEIFTDSLLVYIANLFLTNSLLKT